MQWYKKSLNNGYSEARFEIGMIYYNEFGYNDQTDYKKAIRYLREVTRNENELPSCRYIARMFFTGGYRIKKDYEQALFWYLKQDNIPSDKDYLILARIYAEGGFGVKKDYKEAEKWCLKSKWSESYVILGNIYFKGGHGLEKNYVTAYDYWSECHGSDKAYSMGIFYALRDDEQDFKKALTWFKQSGDTVDPTCQVAAGLLYEKGLGVARDYIEAMFWYKTACLKSNGGAFIRVGWLYHKGLGVQPDLKKAYDMYEYVLNNEHSDLSHKYHAMAYIGLLYKDGLNVTQSDKIAIEYFQKAADGGDPDGCNFMGDIYKYGRGVALDYEKAFQYYVKCDEACHNNMVFCDEGWLNLGIMYLNGLGTEVNRELALMYLKKALKYGNDEASTFIDKIVSDLNIVNATIDQDNFTVQYPSTDTRTTSSDQMNSPVFLHVDAVNAIILDQEKLPTLIYVEDKRDPIPLEAKCGDFLHLEDFVPEPLYYMSPTQI
ncbi:hypothetical protein INT47_009600 [Mucor saturninus]|uniref:Uncharacterized protein n=1 Tax=Mucor saturninus TaxID=64648 RepID=A0A8H7QIV0_9FUNG|nr:hypothetical protein INT47_009600 [Mucor saturninus]